MHKNTFFYLLIIFIFVLFTVAHAVSHVGEELNNKVKISPKKKPKSSFTTNFKWPSFSRKPAEIRKKLPKSDWLKLGNIPRSNSKKGSKVLISPADSAGSDNTTLSATTQDSAVSSASVSVRAPVNITGRKNSKVVPITEKQENPPLASSSHPLDSFSLDSQQSHISNDEHENKLNVLPAEHNTQAELSIVENHEMLPFSQQVANDAAIKRQRGYLNDALKDWYSDLAEKRAEAIRLESEVERLKLSQFKGIQRERENELLNCYDDIQWIQSHIERCKSQLAALPKEYLEENSNRLKNRRKAVLLGY